ncbi:LytTR family DNA-binding domain-containing protein [Sphingobium boeckii]|uniref:HTH LytTR-type domain-containing protein n=1 Tax=Sphingobium boeckii TaxID=1082345 RepID=A0A7W9AGB6_9SPHN|nr:LytTR family DNA-binding domain-containing protein [Sphingobium boeckii]MBB5684924.1 hypothetical protein [Sphingobium boeckii]
MRYLTFESRLRDTLFSPEDVKSFLVVFAIMEAIALPLGWLNAGRTSGWPIESAMVFWIGASLLTLVVYEFTTRGARILLKPWQPPLWVVLIAGAILATPLLELGKHVYVLRFQSAFVLEDLWRPAPSTSLGAVAPRQTVNILMWLLINLALVHYHGLQRFGYRRTHMQPALQPSSIGSEGIIHPALSPPAFAMRIKKPIGALWALVAEEHYLRVIGEKGEDLILYRISDAIGELEGKETGARVHRSYWVARRAIERTERTVSGPILVLHNGRRIPVSRRNRLAAVEAGLL